MAQHDTGLGWSANEEWLVSATATIASISTIGGPLFPNQPINHGLSINDFETNSGFQYWVYNGGGAYYESYMLSDPNYSDVVIFGYVSGNEKWVIIVSANPEIKVYTADKDRYGYSTFQTWAATGTRDSTTGLYYYGFMSGNRYISLSADLPQFASLRAGLDAVQVISTTFDKTNAGASVACVAKWKTQNGTELISPILISSNTEYTDMEESESSYNLAKLNFLLSGVRFYMAFWDIPGETSLTSSFPSVDLTDRGNITLDQLFMYIVSTTYAHVIIINSPDPYEHEGGGSGEEGGDGEDLEDDQMGITHHAIPAAINTGFCRIYTPNEQQLRDLSNYLWSAQYDLTAVKKLFANPMDSILGLSAVPIYVTGASRPVYLGGVDTQMSFAMVDYQSYQVPMGYINVEKRWGSYLDYDPYTKFSIFLPFIGFKDLSADDIMGKQIILDYDVDILSGACTARLQAGGNVLYQWSGQCSIQLPVTASNWNQVFQSATSAALSAGLSVATGSAGPVLAGALAAEGAQAIMGKPRIERGGTASGAAGWMGGLTPYLVRVTPEAIIPRDQNKFIGYPAFSSISLGDLTGYNEISSIHLEGIPATGAELEELEAILKGGVIF